MGSVDERFRLEEEHFADVAERLWAAYRREDRGDSHFMMPRNRARNIRVSEQELRVLLCHALEDTGAVYYGVEVPTRLQYQQSGKKPGTARIDVGLYADPKAEPFAGIELKSGNCGVEAFRKDFEKLLREGRDAYWMHVVEDGRRSLLGAILKDAAAAIRSCQNDFGPEPVKFVFVFVFLAPRAMAVAELSLAGEPRGDIATLLDIFRLGALNDGVWRTFEADSEGNARRSAGAFLQPPEQPGGLRRGQFVYVPTEADDRVFHLSVRGGGYTLRDFTERGVIRYRPQWAPYVADLLDSDGVRLFECTARDRRHKVTTVRDKPYWLSRCRQVYDAEIAGRGPAE